nr:hypothetical protein [Tanacetum cinerariifolium]
MVNDVNVEIHGVNFKVILLFQIMLTMKNLLSCLEGTFWLKEIPPTSTVPPQPIYHPLTPKQKEKVKEVLDIKYKELEESKPIIEVLENYAIYKKKLDEILIGKERLNKKECSEEDKVGIIEHELPKKMCDPGNYVLPVKINGVVEMVALVDIRASRVFVDYSWERELSIDDEIYPEWVLEFFSTFYFDKDVDRTNLMKEKCIWFRLCGHEHILTLPEFAVLLGLFTKNEVEHRLFKIYFSKLKVDDKQFDHKDYWTRVGQPTLANHKEVLVKEPLLRIMHKVIVGSLVHKEASRERCQKWDLWMMSTLEESRGVNLAWVIADHLYKHTPGAKENSVICVGHYVTGTASFLGHYVDDEIKKCSELIDCKYWTSRMLADELDEENTCLKKEAGIPTQAAEGSNGQRQEHEGNQSNQGGSYGLGGDNYFTSAMPDFRGSSSGYAFGGLSKDARFNDDDMDE